jgi:hypothetical protein
MSLPADVVASLGAGKRPAVRVTINGYTYRNTVAVHGGEFLLGVSAQHRAVAAFAARFFDGLSCSKRLRHVLSLDDAKTPETRERRIAKSVAMLRAGRA